MLVCSCKGGDRFIPTIAELGFELDFGILFFLVFSVSEILGGIFCVGSLVSCGAGGCPLLTPLLYFKNKISTVITTTFLPRKT